MTNNFTPKKSGTAARPQLSPEEYAAKKKEEKDAVYQMIDDTLNTVKKQMPLLTKPLTSLKVTAKKKAKILTLPQPLALGILPLHPLRQRAI